MFQELADCSGLIPERERSISPVCFYGCLPNYYSHVYCPVRLMNGWVFVYLQLLKWIVRGCEPSLAYSVDYYQKCALFWVMVTGSGNSVLAEPLGRRNKSWVRVEIRFPGSRERRMNYFPWLVSCRLIRLNFGGCSIVGKPLCYHARDPGSIPHGGRTNRSPYLLALLGQLSLPSFRGR